MIEGARQRLPQRHGIAVLGVDQHRLRRDAQLVKHGQQQQGLRLAVAIPQGPCVHRRLGQVVAPVHAVEQIVDVVLNGLQRQRGAFQRGAAGSADPFDFLVQPAARRDGTRDRIMRRHGRGNIRPAVETADHYRRRRLVARRRIVGHLLQLVDRQDHLDRAIALGLAHRRFGCRAQPAEGQARIDRPRHAHPPEPHPGGLGSQPLDRLHVAIQRLVASADGAGEPQHIADLETGHLEQRGQHAVYRAPFQFGFAPDDFGTDPLFQQVDHFAVAQDFEPVNHRRALVGHP